MAMGSASVPTLWATMEASTASAVSVMVITRSVFDSQWPPKSPAWMTPVTCSPPGVFVTLNVLGLGLENQPVHGVALGAGQLADVVGRQRDGVALPLRGQRLAVRRELAANPVRIRHQERRAQPVAQIAVGIVVHVQHLLGGGQIGRGKHIHFALAGEVGGDLQKLHAAAGRERDAGELRLGCAHRSAAEGDDLLAADLGYVLGVAC